jgi:hypothetical protein
LDEGLELSQSSSFLRAAALFTRAANAFSHPHDVARALELKAQCFLALGDDFSAIRAAEEVSFSIMKRFVHF